MSNFGALARRQRVRIDMMIDQQQQQQRQQQVGFPYSSELLGRNVM